MEGKIIRHPLPPITDRAHPFYNLRAAMSSSFGYYYVGYVTNPDEFANFFYVSHKEDPV